VLSCRLFPFIPWVGCVRLAEIGLWRHSHVDSETRSDYNGSFQSSVRFRLTASFDGRLRHPPQHHHRHQHHHHHHHHHHRHHHRHRRCRQRHHHRFNDIFCRAYITIAIRLQYDYDTTIPRRIRLRRKWPKLRFAFDSTAMRLRHDYDEKMTCSFFFARVESRRMEAGARDTS